MDHIFSDAPNIQTDDLLSLLRFAAGVSNEMPEKAREHPDQALNALRHHRMIGRALIACYEKKRENLHPLQMRLEGIQDEIKAEQRKRDHIISSFISEFCFDMDVFILKGQSAFYRCGRQELIRPSVDVDLAVSKPSTLKSRLAKRALIKETNNARIAVHEFTGARFQGLEFDFHKYIPSWHRHEIRGPWKSIDPGIALSYTTVEQRISPGDLEVTGHQVDLFGQKAIVAGSTMAAVISMVAAHRDYIMHLGSHLQERALCRASDLCEVRDCLDSPDFSPSNFMDAIRHYRAEDALEWFGAVMNFLLGDGRALYMWHQITGESSPRERNYRLIGSSFWMQFAIDPIRDLFGLPGTKDLFRYNEPAVFELADGETLHLGANETTKSFLNSTWTLGGPMLDQCAIRITRKRDSLAISYAVGAEISDMAGLYFECNNEMFQWENLGNFSEMKPFAFTEGAKSKLREFRWENESRASFVYDLDGGTSTADLAIGASIPQLPWNAYLGWLSLLRLTLRD